MDRTILEATKTVDRHHRCLPVENGSAPGIPIRTPLASLSLPATRLAPGHQNARVTLLRVPGGAPKTGARAAPQSSCGPDGPPRHLVSVATCARRYLP
jgi:hypothetical protein